MGFFKSGFATFISYILRKGEYLKKYRENYLLNLPCDIGTENLSCIFLPAINKGSSKKNVTILNYWLQ
jgi:hypothetical protein